MTRLDNDTILFPAVLLVSYHVFKVVSVQTRFSHKIHQHLQLKNEIMNFEIQRLLPSPPPKFEKKTSNLAMKGFH